MEIKHCAADIPDCNCLAYKPDLFRSVVNYVNACLIASDGDPGKKYYADDFHRMEEKIDKILEMLGQGNKQGDENGIRNDDNHGC